MSGRRPLPSVVRTPPSGLTSAIVICRRHRSFHVAEMYCGEDSVYKVMMEGYLLPPSSEPITLKYISCQNLLV